MKKTRFALTFLMIFLVALFASCSPDVGTPEDNTNNGKDPWPNLENFYGRTFDIMQEDEAHGNKLVKVGTLEITNDGDVIIKDPAGGNGMMGGYNSLKEYYDAATCRVYTGAGDYGFDIIFDTYPNRSCYQIKVEDKLANIAGEDLNDYNYTLVETTSSNN